MNKLICISLVNRNYSSPLMLGLMMFLSVMTQTASAQNDPFTPEANTQELSPQQQEIDAQEMLKGVEKLVLSQQRRVAKEVIRKYPKSKTAKIAELLLEEYSRFDRLKEVDEAAEAAWRNEVRNHWFVERNPVHNSCFFTILEGTQVSPALIINRSKTPVLYEMKGPSMPWNGPYRLRPSESHDFNYPVQIRFFSDQGVVVKHLSQGQTLQLNEKNTLHIK
ncbi:hypothetical protein [Gimesia algae]|uniref:Secreted protein n=1 Tax=Gimesia algae TaxID=2527971 RepID=A0A517VLX4_9PLAN|nr:hypothetical protein [Gimesia algae]QDT93900.1 hypothetical protein Pan161_55870 [Gimesia algae]